MIKRLLQKQIEEVFFKGKAVIIYGAKQVGKTTLINQIREKYADSTYLNCDEPDIKSYLTDATSTRIKSLVGNSKLVFIDEAQRVKNIGLTLKLFVDQLPSVQVVATGSSSLELSDEVVEPLTGRKYEFHLYPFSMEELLQKYSSIEIDRIIERRMIMGMYPEVVEKPQEDQRLLRTLASSYLYKDVLQYQDIRRPELLEKLLTALALQIGSEVSYNELGSALGVSKQTVSNYINLLEKSFVIFRLAPFSKNLRTELTKLRKIYFVDLGIRNALINSFNPHELRQDVGQLWENFMISERLKHNVNREISARSYFWRTYGQQEIDYIEEAGGQLTAFEFKWKEGKQQSTKGFTDTYPNSKVEFINRSNFKQFLGL